MAGNYKLTERAKGIGGAFFLSLRKRERIFRGMDAYCERGYNLE
ncbi:hypothetical protein LEP1GSC172_1265 [Leptospira noguchii]|uniref:Uncharacterized protein n=1 Tax=Leptospira noguchii TaxID=28182 RepID=M6V8I8_9LEPT|nr:hypothetical protein LEP1GSC172_1265 [Leptospira noguchii]